MPRVAELPYSAHAIASRIVVLPEPFVPMMPVSPVSNVTTDVRVLAEVLELQPMQSHGVAPHPVAARPLATRRRFERTAQRVAPTSRLAQVVEPERHEAVAIDVARHDAPLQVLAHGVGQRRPAARAAARDGADDLRTPRVEVKVQRAPLESRSAL